MTAPAELAAEAMVPSEPEVLHLVGRIRAWAERLGLIDGCRALCGADVTNHEWFHGDMTDCPVLVCAECERRERQWS